MKCNGYDFDKTIYKGDSTLDFYFWCMTRHPKCLLALPKAIYYFFLYRVGRIDKTSYKEAFYRFLWYLPSVEEILNAFIPHCLPKISNWYCQQKSPDDVIISASPEFLVGAICKEIGISKVLASKVDCKTGQYEGKNCHGAEKVKRFQDAFPSIQLATFYSDSTSDLPMAELAEEAYLVCGEQIKKWRR